MELFKLFGTILVDNDKANESIHKTEKQADSLSGKLAGGIKTAVKWGAGIAAAAGAGATALYKMAEEATKTADTIDKGSIRMGVSTDYFQELSYAAGQCGVEMSVMEKAAKKLEGTDLNLDQAMEQIMSLTTEEERSAKAAELFGDAVAYQMAPLLASGGESFDELRQRAHDLGIVMDEESVAAGVKLGDTISDVKQAFGAIVTQIGVSVMPVIQEVLDWVLAHMPEIKAVTSQAFEYIKQGIALVIQIIQAVWPAVEGAWNFIKPLLDYIIQFLDFTFSGGFKRLYETIKDTCTKALKPFSDMVTGFKTAWDKLKSFLKLPHFNIQGSFSLMPPSVPKFSIDWYDKAMEDGMIMNVPTIFGMNAKGIPMAGGESGSEAVVGTQSLRNMIDESVKNANNEKMDMLIDLVSQYLPIIAEKDLVISSNSVYTATNRIANLRSNAELKFKGGL